MKQVYMCEYCGKVGAEAYIAAHEQVCADNPACHKCPTCKYQQHAWLRVGKCYGCKIIDNTTLGMSNWAPTEELNNNNIEKE